VAVDVNVQDRSRRVVTGLKPGDFQVFDNGVPQRVHEVSYGKLPIDVTVALDVSYSVTGALLSRLRQGVLDLMRDLGSEDRLKLVLFNMRVTRTTDFTRDVAPVERAIREAKAGGGTALLDAVSVAMVSATDPNRRQLIVFFTDGSDSSSTTTPETAVAVAQRTRATLAFVVPGQVPAQTIVTARPGTSVPVPTVVNRYSTGLPIPPVLARLATDTGGAVLPVSAGLDLSSVFRRVLGDFRSTYVLYYSPTGVGSTGYHRLEVKVNRNGAQVRARRGYFDH
jgi:VWFA-related protein